MQSSPPRLSTAARLIAVMALLGACGGSAGSTEPATASPSATSGSESPYAGPIGSTDVEHGQERFTVACASCHHDGLPSNLGWAPERMRQQVREGSGNMPPIGPSRLSDADLEAVVAYLASTGAVAAPAAAAQ